MRIPPSSPSIERPDLPDLESEARAVVPTGASKRIAKKAAVELAKLGWETVKTGGVPPVGYLVGMLWRARTIVKEAKAEALAALEKTFLQGRELWAKNILTAVDGENFNVSGNEKIIGETRAFLGKTLDAQPAETPAFGDTPEQTEIRALIASLDADDSRLEATLTEVGTNVPTTDEAAREIFEKVKGDVTADLETKASDPVSEAQVEPAEPRVLHLDPNQFAAEILKERTAVDTAEAYRQVNLQMMRLDVEEFGIAEFGPEGSETTYRDVKAELMEQVGARLKDADAKELSRMSWFDYAKELGFVRPEAKPSAQHAAYLKAFQHVLAQPALQTVTVDPVSIGALRRELAAQTDDSTEGQNARAGIEQMILNMAMRNHFETQRAAQPAGTTLIPVQRQEIPGVIAQLRAGLRA